MQTFNLIVKLRTLTIGTVNVGVIAGLESQCCGHSAGELHSSLITNKPVQAPSEFWLLPTYVLS